MAMLKKSPAKGKAINLKIPADASYISLVRLMLGAQLREKGIDEESVEDLKLAVGEFLAKAISAGIVGKYISIDMAFSDNKMDLKINNVEEFKPDELFDSPYLNFTVITNLVDHFDLLLSEQQSFTVNIIKRFVA